MNITRLKQALAHADQGELSAMLKWIGERKVQLRNFDERRLMDIAFERIKHLKDGDHLYAHNRLSAYWKIELTICSRPRPRSRDLWILTPSNMNRGSATSGGREMQHGGLDVTYLKTDMIFRHDLRPEPCAQAVLETIKGPEQDEPIPF